MGFYQRIVRAKQMNATQRYASQTVLDEIGVEGQQRLAKARVLVVGAGGLGSSVLLYLTAAGVGQKMHGGRIGIIDDDQVDTSNLQRQILFREKDLGQAKATAGAHHLECLNSSTQIHPMRDRLRIENVLEIFSDYDIIVDGSDNFATKFLINDAAVKLGLPVVYGSVLGFEGQACIFWAQHGPCYRCLYPHPPVTHVPNCAQYGTLGGVAGVIGAIQSVEVCKLALGLAHCEERGLTTLIGQFWVADARYWDTRNLKISKNPMCTVCSIAPQNVCLTQSPSTFCTSHPVAMLDLAALEAMHQSGHDVLILDVRELHEWQTKHLPNARLVPLHSLLSDQTVLDSLERQKTIVVYCEHGTRSARACQYLIERGFSACNLIIDWTKIDFSAT